MMTWKADMLVHKGFFDNRDREALGHLISERMLQVRVCLLISTVLRLFSVIFC